MPGQTHSFVEHIKIGVKEAAADQDALLLFSGGKTRRCACSARTAAADACREAWDAWFRSLRPCPRRDAGPRAEGEGYWLVAEASKWWGNEEVRDRAFTEVTAAVPVACCAATRRPFAAECRVLCIPVSSCCRTAHATRLRTCCSGELLRNAGWQARCECCMLLACLEQLMRPIALRCSRLCRFNELTGRYPEFIVVVGYEFKRRRFSEVHRAALRLPQEAFRYEGTPALNAAALVVRRVWAWTAAAAGWVAGQFRGAPRQRHACCAGLGGLQGEQATVAAFEADPYGCHGELAAKRQQRDPFSVGGYTGDRCLDMAELLQHCGPQLYDGPLPWDGTT